MESSSRSEIKVGLFTLVGIVLFCLSVILLGGDKWFFTKSYKLKIRLPQAQGLAQGSVVSLTGVQVGNVNDIVFIDGSNEVEVLVTIREAVRSRITEGSKASIKTQGALGDKFVYIEPGPPNAPALKDGAILEADKTPDFIDMIASKGTEFGEIVNVIKEVKIMFENINREGRSAKLMSNMVVASEEMTKAAVEARETMKLLRTETIQPLSSVMKKLDNGTGTLGALINDSSLHQRIGAFFGETPRNRFLKPLIRESIQTNEQKK